MFEFFGVRLKAKTLVALGSIYNAMINPFVFEQTRNGFDEHIWWLHDVKIQDVLKVFQHSWDSGRKLSFPGYMQIYLNPQSICKNNYL